jgi:hypothetical protein
MVNAKFCGLPPLRNARRKSRTIYALISYILVTESRANAAKVCSFICDKWCDVWFGNHFFNESKYQELEREVVKFLKAAVCLKNHCSKMPSHLHAQRSNIWAEHAVKVLHSKENLNLRFLLLNLHQYDIHLCHELCMMHYE